MFALPVLLESTDSDHSALQASRRAPSQASPHPYTASHPPSQATRKGWPYYRRRPGPAARAANASCIVGPPLAGGLRCGRPTVWAAGLRRGWPTVRLACGAACG